MNLSVFCIFCCILNLRLSVFYLMHIIFSCSTSDGYVQCNLASCCAQIGPRVYGSKSNKGNAFLVCFCFQSTWLVVADSILMFHFRLLLDQKILQLTMTWCKLLKYWMTDYEIPDYLPCLTNTIKHKGTVRFHFLLYLRLISQHWFQLAHWELSIRVDIDKCSSKYISTLIIWLFYCMKFGYKWVGIDKFSSKYISTWL